MMLRGTPEALLCTKKLSAIGRRLPSRVVSGSLMGNSFKIGVRDISRSAIAQFVEVQELSTIRDKSPDPPFCPLPNFSTESTMMTLLEPLRDSESSDYPESSKPLLIYFPGMDGTGQVIRSQIEGLNRAGYDVRCLYIPSSDRSTWDELVDQVLPLLTQEAARCSDPGQSRSITVLAESFGGCLALRTAIRAPSLISRLIIVNPATSFRQGNLLGSLAARTGLLAFFPPPLYELAQDILLPLLVKRSRVSSESSADRLSPLDYVPAPCAAWRLSLLNEEEGISDDALSRIFIPTLLIAGGKDRILPSMSETNRLQRLLPNSVRTVLPESGHTIFLEKGIDMAAILEKNGFEPPGASSSPKSPPPAVQWAKDRKDADLDSRLEEMGQILEPWRIITSPLVSGDENLPDRATQRDRGVLFVGNHTLFGLYDSPLLVHELYLRGFRCRGLAHPGHWLTGAGTVMERYGNTKATPRAAYKLLKEGKHVLLFPGGAREVCKRKGEEYQLQWKEKVDFVRMASRLGALIVPFGAVGGDDAFEILYDANDILKSAAGPLVEQLYRGINVDPEESLYPISAIPGTNLPSLVPIPKIERIYFHFGEPIDTLEYKCDLKSSSECESLYNLVRSRVERSILHLKSVRKNDPEREFGTRMARKALRLLPEFIPREKL